MSCPQVKSLAHRYFTPTPLHCPTAVQVMDFAICTFAQNPISAKQHISFFNAFLLLIYNRFGVTLFCVFFWKRQIYKETVTLFSACAWSCRPSRWTTCRPRQYIRRRSWYTPTRSACLGRTWARTTCCSVYSCSSYMPNGSACARADWSDPRTPSRNVRNRKVSPRCGTGSGPAGATDGWRPYRRCHTCVWGRVWAGAWTAPAWRRTSSRSAGTSWPTCCQGYGASACGARGCSTSRSPSRTRCMCSAASLNSSRRSSCLVTGHRWRRTRHTCNQWWRCY